MATERARKAREFITADIADAIDHIEDALKLLPRAGWAPAERDPITNQLRVAYGAIDKARELVDELDGERAEGAR